MTFRAGYLDGVLGRGWHLDHAPEVFDYPPGTDGESLFKVIGSIGRDRADQQLACFLAASRTDQTCSKLTSSELDVSSIW